MEHGNSGGPCGGLTLAKPHGCFIENLHLSNREMLFVKSGPRNYDSDGSPIPLLR